MLMFEYLWLKVQIASDNVGWVPYRSSYDEDFVIKATKFVSWLQFEENISMYYGPGLVKLATNWLRQGPG